MTVCLQVFPRFHNYLRQYYGDFVINPSVVNVIRAVGPTNITGYGKMR